MTTTSHGSGPIGGAQRGGEAVAHRREFEWLARGGLVARGVVYGIIRILALKLAVGSGGKTTTQRGAMMTLAHEPFGKALLIATAVGLAGYAMWRLVRAGIGHGTEQKDSGFQRVAGLASGFAYGALCVTAVRIVTGANSSGGTNSPKKTTAGVLGWTDGTVIVGAVGAILIGVALLQGYKGVSKKFLDDSKTREMSREGKRAFTATGLRGCWFLSIELGHRVGSLDTVSRCKVGPTVFVELRRSSTAPEGMSPTEVVHIWRTAVAGGRLEWLLAR